MEPLTVVSRMFLESFESLKGFRFIDIYGEIDETRTHTGPIT